MLYKVKEVADMVGVSVRTLHYYDEISLLQPGTVSPVGYRLYNGKDLERLQQILFFKELGFSLQETGKIMESPGYDRKQALIRHKELLLIKKNRLERIITSVEETIESIDGGVNMENEKMFKAFDMSEIESYRENYAEEAHQKYGDSDAYKESVKKTAKYSKEDWAGIMKEADEIYKKVIENMDRGPADKAVQSAVAELRQHITDNYYNCTPEIFRGLGDLYVADERFTANIDRYRPGLAKFLREAMHIYCDNL